MATMTMSTEPIPASASDSGQRARILDGPLTFAFAAAFAALTSFYLLLAVLPRYAAASGLGGSVTAVLLAGTIAAELTGTRVTRRLGHRAALGIGAILMGLPTLVLLMPDARGIAAIGAVAIACGYGFGLATVTASALVARLIPPDRLGEGLGLDGIVECAPAIVALPAGLWLAAHLGTSTVVVLAAVVALAPLITLPKLSAPASAPTSASGTVDEEKLGGLLAAIRRGGQLGPFLIFASTTTASGTVATLLPLATGVSGGVAAVALLLEALTAMVGRLWAGRYGDRHGHSGMLTPALAAAALGMACLLGLDTPAAVVVGMCVFGAGFGIVQNATFALMIGRAPASDPDSPSALWNLSYDAGFGAGPAVFGLLATHGGFAVAFALAAMPIVAVMPIARADRRRHRAADQPSLVS